jgi:1,4-alpha-glucan branching enzyme
MDQSRKWVFWGAAIGAFLIVCVPSSYLLEAGSRYYAALSGVEPASRRSSRCGMNLTLTGRSTAGRLDFVHFSLRRPKARRVELIGDFNGWKDGSLPLAKSGEGRWELLLPLSPGAHRYLFLIDGKPELDSSNPRSETVNGRAASVKNVP